MKVILFDRGNTLEHDDVLLPGAIELLTAVRDMKDTAGSPVELGLVSNFGKAATAAEIPDLRNEYLSGAEQIGLLPFFTPVDKRITLSSDSLDADFVKPKAAIFRAALDKLSAELSFSRALFITEELPHVQAARGLGMAAIHFKGPGQTAGEVATLIDLIPLIKNWVNTEGP